MKLNSRYKRLLRTSSHAKKKCQRRPEASPCQLGMVAQWGKPWAPIANNALSGLAPNCPQYRRGSALKICNPLIRTRNTHRALTQCNRRVARLWRRMISSVVIGAVIINPGAAAVRPEARCRCRAEVKRGGG